MYYVCAVELYNLSLAVNCTIVPILFSCMAFAVFYFYRFLFYCLFGVLDSSSSLFNLVRNTDHLQHSAVYNEHNFMDVVKIFTRSQNIENAIAYADIFCGNPNFLGGSTFCQTTPRKFPRHEIVWE